MKIIYIYDAIARIGGTEKILVDKMNSLTTEYDQEIYLITTCQGNHPIVFPLSPKVKHTDLSVRFHTIYNYSFFKRIYMSWKMDRQLIKKLNEITDKIRPDIIIATTYYGADTICKIKCNAKKIIESHCAINFTGQHDGIKRNYISNLFKIWKLNKSYTAIKKRSDAIVTLTKGDAKDWNVNNVVVIPDIIDIKNKEYSQLTNKTAIFVGRFIYQKGLERMLEAWKIVVNERKDWTLKLVGEGELKNELKEQCQKLGIETNVMFVPATKDIAKEYINSSVFLFTSRFEGFGLVLVEAMQCGVPCISFDCPYGPSDIIDSGINGYLIEDGDIERFAQAVLKLINDDELRKKMGKEAINKAECYRPEIIMPKWIELYNNLLSK